MCPDILELEIVQDHVKALANKGSLLDKEVNDVIEPVEKLNKQAEGMS